MNRVRTRRPANRALAGVLAICLALVGLGTGALPAGAQQSGPDIEVSGIDLTEFPRVRMAVALGPALASAAGASDLRLLENGEPVDATITPLDDETVGVVLAIDTSGSIAGEALDQAKVAAQGMLDNLPEDAPVSVIGFGTTASVASEFTTDRATTSAAISALQAQGGTALYDAVLLAAEQAGDSGADRNAIVLLSDGADSESSSGIEEASDSLEDGIDNLYLVSLQTEETDDDALDALAESAGGRVIAAQDPEALSATYVDLAERIANQYEVVFTSTTAENVGRYEIVAGDETAPAVEIALPDRPTATTAAPSGPRDVEALTYAAEVEPFQQDWVMWVGAALLATAITIALFLAAPAGAGAGTGAAAAARRRLGRRSLASDATVVDEGSGAERAFESVREAAVGVATRAVERTESTSSIDEKLDRAGIIMRAGEFVALVVAVAIGAGVAGYLLLGVVGGALGLLVPLFGANAFLGFKAGRRNRRFGDQLSDALQIMSGSLRSGFGVGQAIDTVAEEMDDPIGAEFRRAILETRLGRDVEDALDAVAKRVQNEDFEWVVDAMRINRQVGGDLAQILDQVGETIRARNRLKRQVAALTAEGRISALVLGFLPIGLGLVLYTSNPDYMDPLFSSGAGLIMLGVAVGLLVAGALWLKKMIDVEY